MIPDIWAMPSGFPELAPGQVQVWRLRTDRDSRAGLALLSAAERRRAEGFRTELMRTRHVAAHAAVRLLLGRALGVPGDQLRFGQNAWGKPELVGPDSSGSDLRFNLSHSGDWALIAMARGIDVGVDVELVSDPPPIEVAGMVYSAAERAALAALSGPALTAAFYAIWTRKEALSKGLGLGFSIDFASFGVSPEPSLGISRPLLPPKLEAAAGWHLVDLPPIDGAAGALAVPGGDFDVSAWRFEAGLWGL
jgi:4'-phosphopantetheinyl transferase